MQRRSLFPTGFCEGAALRGKGLLRDIPKGLRSARNSNFSLFSSHNTFILSLKALTPPSKKRKCHFNFPQIYKVWALKPTAEHAAAYCNVKKVTNSSDLFCASSPIQIFILLSETTSPFLWHMESTTQFNQEATKTSLSSQLAANKGLVMPKLKCMFLFLCLYFSESCWNIRALKVNDCFTGLLLFWIMFHVNFCCKIFASFIGFLCPFSLVMDLHITN